MAAEIRKGVSRRAKRINISRVSRLLVRPKQFFNKKAFFIEEARIPARGSFILTIKVLSRVRCIKDDKNESLDAAAISCVVNYLEIALLCANSPFLTLIKRILGRN